MGVYQATADINELKAIRARYESELEAVTAEQAGIRDTLDGLIVAAPSSVPLDVSQRQIVEAGIAAQVASEQFAETVKRLLMVIDASITREQLLCAAADCVARSYALLASVHSRLCESGEVAARSNELLSELGGRAITFPRVGRRAGAPQQVPQYSSATPRNAE